MNLRKVLLTLLAILFSVLTYAILQAYTILTVVMEEASITYAQTTGGTLNGIVVWMQFPIILLSALIIAYLLFGDKSLTNQALNPRSLKK